MIKYEKFFNNEVEMRDFVFLCENNYKTQIIDIAKKISSDKNIKFIMLSWRGKANSLDVKGRGFDVMSMSADAGASLVAVERRADEALVSLAVRAEGRPASLAFEIPTAEASVAGGVALSPFSAYYTLERRYYAVGRLADGTCIVENRLSAFDVPPGLALRMTSGSGICFDDGAGRLTISAEDFDEIGDFSYRFYVPEGVRHPCQFLRLMNNGKAVAQ